ncbi:hypothetical protein Ddc_13603 [Ditylenchus destructor]|nr:hypothetical protein Ddc_13603 [Ditylenchus destructor]
MCFNLRRLHQLWICDSNQWNSESVPKQAEKMTSKQTSGRLSTTTSSSVKEGFGAVESGHVSKRFFRLNFSQTIL